MARPKRKKIYHTIISEDPTSYRKHKGTLISKQGKKYWINDPLSVSHIRFFTVPDVFKNKI